MERLLINKANKKSEKEVAKLKKFEESNAKRLSNMQKIEHLHMEKMEKYVQKLSILILRESTVMIQTFLQS